MLAEHVQHMSVSGYVYLRGDQMNMQRVGCLCPLFLALSTALVIVWVVISEHDGGRLGTRCRLPSWPWSWEECTIAVYAGYFHSTHIPSYDCFQWVHRVVRQAPLGELCSRNNHPALQFHYYDTMCHIALLPKDQELRWCLSSSFYPLRSPETDPLINHVHLICATHPGVSHTSPIHV